MRTLHALRRGVPAIAAATAILACSDDTTGPEAARTRTLPTHDALLTALRDVVAQGAVQNGGLGFDMWASVVDRDGIVVAVAFSGDRRDDQWPGSRVIAAQKANTANAFSLAGFALSTANLYTAVQPGGTLFGLQESNPVDPAVAYGGKPADYGTTRDPMIGHRIGGVNVFGGGLALYNSQGVLIGALGVSGDTSCSDHIIAWKVRDQLGLDHVPAGPAPNNEGSTDNIIYDFDEAEPSGFGHPECSPEATAIGEALPDNFPVGGQ